MGANKAFGSGDNLHAIWGILYFCSLPREQLDYVTLLHTCVIYYSAGHAKKL